MIVSVVNISVVATCVVPSGTWRVKCVLRKIIGMPVSTTLNAALIMILYSGLHPVVSMIAVIRAPLLTLVRKNVTAAVMKVLHPEVARVLFLSTALGPSVYSVMVRKDFVSSYPSMFLGSRVVTYVLVYVVMVRPVSAVIRTLSMTG